MERELDITEARKQLGQIVDQVKYRGDHYVIIRHGQPAAAVVPIEVYRQWKQEHAELFDVIHRLQQTCPDADPDQIMQAVLEAQQAIRHRSAE